VAHLSPALARRIDRLARRAHGFHRLAHHPLCARYAGEVVRLGRRRRLCRGCLLAAAGALSGLCAGAVLPARPVLGAVAALLALAAPAATSRAAGARRPSKLLTRLLPTAAAGVALAQARAASSLALAAALWAVAAIGAAVAVYRRRGPDRRPCEGCPDGPPAASCPGFARLRSRERALQRLAGRWIAVEARGAAPWIR
jgi:hypothetical protein